MIFLAENMFLVFNFLNKDNPKVFYHWPIQKFLSLANPKVFHTFHPNTLSCSALLVTKNPDHNISKMKRAMLVSKLRGKLGRKKLPQQMKKKNYLKNLEKKNINECG